MLRQSNVNHRSGVSDIYLRSFRDTSTANFSNLFMFVRCQKIECLEFGWHIKTFTGTSVVTQCRTRTVGYDGGKNLRAHQTAGHSTFDPGDTVLTGAGWQSLRADPKAAANRSQNLGERVLGGDASTGNTFDALTNINVTLTFITKTGVSAFDGYLWARFRVWYPEER